MWPRRSLARFAALAAVVAPLTLMACNPDKISNGGGPELGEFAVTANVVGTPIATLVVTVTAPDITTPLVFNLTVHDGTATGTIKLPPGAARLITVEAFDSNGDVTHEGHKTIDVRPGQNPPVNIPMVAKSGHVEITVQLGAVSIVVTPAELTTYVDASAQLSAVIRAPNGDVLTDATPEWATNNPTIATVDQHGNVSGVREGTVDIVATYAGIAGISHITVQPSCVGCNWTTARVQLYSPPFRGSFNGIWGTSGTNVYGVTGEGDILRYTGSGWNVDLSVPNGFFTTISGASSSDIWAIGFSTYHYDGTSWTQMEFLPQTGTSVFVTSVGTPSGTSAVFVTSYDGRIFRRSGTSWMTDYTDATGNYLLSIWGSSATDIFAGGSNGTLVHYNGNAWTPMVSGTLGYITSIWGSGPSDVYAAAGNQLLHYNGTSWSSVSLPSYLYAYVVTGSGPNDVFAMGFRTFAHYDGSSWTSITTPTTWVANAIAGWGGSSTGLFFGAYPGASGRYRNGSFSNLSLNPAISGLSVVSKTSAWAVGDEGLVYKFNGSSWSAVDGPSISSFAYDVFAAGDNDVYTTACQYIRHFNGSMWTSQFVSPSNCLFYIAGSSASNIFAVGGATIFRYDGTSWSQMATGTSHSFLDVWTSGPSNAYAIGVDPANGTGTLFQYDGLSWSSVGTPFGSGAYLRSVGGSGPNDVYLVGQDAATFTTHIAHFDGTSWSFMPTPTNASAWSVFASNPNDVYLAGFESSSGTYVVFRWNGSTWQTKTNSGGYLFKVTGKPGVDVFGIGPNATILHGNSTVTASLLASMRSESESHIRVPPPILGSRIMPRQPTPLEQLLDRLRPMHR